MFAVWRYIRVMTLTFERGAVLGTESFSALCWTFWFTSILLNLSSETLTLSLILKFFPNSDVVESVFLKAASALYVSPAVFKFLEPSHHPRCRCKCGTCYLEQCSGWASDDQCSVLVAFKQSVLVWGVQTWVFITSGSAEEEPEWAETLSSVWQMTFLPLGRAVMNRVTQGLKREWRVHFPRPLSQPTEAGHMTSSVCSATKVIFVKKRDHCRCMSSANTDTPAGLHSTTCFFGLTSLLGKFVCYMAYIYK